jgi:hypothetical protein
MVAAGTRAVCPHCHTGMISVGAKGSLYVGTRAHYNGAMSHFAIWNREPSTITVRFSNCPLCQRAIVSAAVRDDAKQVAHEFPIWPRAVERRVEPEVPSHIAGDYSEAAAVLALSPKASAALSRRCLQAVLREAGTKKKDLADQIEEVLPLLPHDIAQNVDLIRTTGNFAAHPIKSNQTGMIVAVEPHEAEFNLDVLDDLFEYYYVRPARAAAKRAAHEAKLKGAGKPPLKKP